MLDVQSYHNADSNSDCQGIFDEPTRCPPITCLVCAETLFGIAKTIKEVAPIALITTILSLPRMRTRISRTQAAKEL